MTEKPKRVMTPEHLERLAVARAKANEVRSKQAQVKRAEKEEEKKRRQAELDEKYKNLSKPKFIPPELPAHLQPKGAKTDKLEEKVEDAQKLKTPSKKVKKVLEIDSEDGSSSSSSDSEEEYDISPIKHKYKQKYKHKYSARYTQPTQQPYNAHQDAVTIAKYNIQSKVNQEVQKMAMMSLFG